MKEPRKDERKKEANERPSAIIDLDVITVAHWKGMQKQEADKFLARVTAKEFYMVTPFILVELLMGWNDKNLVQKIEDFYSENTDMWLSDRMVEEQAKAIGVDLENLIKELEASGVKQEDSVLVVIAAIFKIDYLITFNRKHLTGKKDVINGVLKKVGLQTIHIANPQELSKAVSNADKSGGETASAAADAYRPKVDNYALSLSLFKNLSDMPFFISSANWIGSTFSGISALAFHFLSLTKTSISSFMRITVFKPFARE